MTNEVKNRIILQNMDNTVNVIKELSVKYEMPVDDIETIYEMVIAIITSKDLIEIEEDMSDVYEILDYITGDRSYQGCLDEQEPEEPELSSYIKPIKTLEESVMYFIKEKYSYAFDDEDIDEDELDDIINSSIAEARFRSKNKGNN